MKESFLLYQSLYGPVKHLSDAQLGRLFRAIFEYQQTGSEPRQEDDIYIAFMFFKSQFERDAKKYEAIVERNRRNGKKGGRSQNPVGSDETQKTHSDNLEPRGTQKTHWVPLAPNGSHSEPENPQEPVGAKKADYEYDTDTDLTNSKELDSAFENFRKEYPGTKRGHVTELKELRKHTDWRKVIPLLLPALLKEAEWRTSCEQAGEFCPNWPHLRTWLHQRRWEQELKPIDKHKSHGTKPSELSRTAVQSDKDAFKSTI